MAKQDYLTDLQALMVKIDTAWNAGDAVAFAACWTEQGTVMNPMGHLSIGRSTIQQDTATDLTGFMAGSRHRLVIERSDSLGLGIALAEGTAELANVTGPDGVIFPPWVAHFMAICVQQSTGQWHIAHMRSYVLQPPAETA